MFVLFDNSGDTTFVFDSLLGSGRESVSSHVDSFGKLTTAENLDAILARDETILFQYLDVEVGDVLGLGQCVDGVDIDTHIFDAVDILEAKFRYATIERHLTAFEAHLLVVAGTCLGAFITAGRGTTFARTGTTTDTLGVLDGSFCGFKIA